MGDKLREMKLAIALEKKFTKEQILEGYLNIVFFNRDAYGIEAASKFFFSTVSEGPDAPPGRAAGRRGEQPVLL